MRGSNARIIALFSVLGFGLTSLALAADPKFDQRSLARGRYVLKTAGCNDCHTPDYPQKGGKIEESNWLTGAPVAAAIARHRRGTA